MVLVVMTSCVAGSPQASSSAARPTPSSATSSQFPVATPTVATPTVASPTVATPTPASPSASASPATGLTCQLPVVVGSTPGFVTFPTGSFRADPNPNIVRVTGSPFAPVLIYDRTYGRWLTIPWWLVSSDGLQYLYRGSDGSVHLATISTGSDNVLVASGASPSGNGWFPVGIASGAIYIAAASNLNGPAPAPFFGLWSAKLDGTDLKSITQSGVWTLIGAGAAWGVTPQTAAALNRLDLSTGTSSVWFAPGPEGAVFLYDVDRLGEPVVGVANVDYYGVALATAKNSLTTITLPAGTYWGGLGHRVQNGLVTSPGIWLTVDDGSILLSRDGKSFGLATTLPGVSNVAGPCL